MITWNFPDNFVGKYYSAETQKQMVLPPFFFTGPQSELNITLPATPSAVDHFLSSTVSAVTQATGFFDLDPNPIRIQFKRKEVNRNKKQLLEKKIHRYLLKK